MTRTVRLPPNSYDHFAKVYDEADLDRFSVDLAGQLRRWCREWDAASLIDIACGTGSLLSEMSRSALSLTGSDISVPMLQQARKKAPGACLLASSYDALPFVSSFDVAVCFYDSLNYVLSDDALGGVFSSVGAALNRGGRFLFDLNNELAFAEVWGNDDEFRSETSSGTLVVKSRYEEATRTGTADVIVETVEDGTAVEYRSVHTQRLVPPKTVISLLEEAGFTSMSVETIDPFPDVEEFALRAKDFHVARLVP